MEDQNLSQILYDQAGPHSEAAEITRALQEAASAASGDALSSVGAEGVVDALAGAAVAPEVGGVGLLTGLSTAMMGKAGLTGLFGPTASAGFIIGGLSAATGAALAKMWSDKVEAVFARRLVEVRKHAPLRAPPYIDLVAAATQLLTSLDWCLELEERRPTCLGLGLRCVGLGRLAATDLGDGTVRLEQPSERSIQRQVNRQQRRIWRQCREHVVPPRSPAATKAPLPLRSRPAALGGSSREARAAAAYEKLFNPQHGTVDGERGLCAALCYLVSAFLDYRHRQSEHFKDAERRSLRLAVAALTRHPLLDDVPGRGKEAAAEGGKQHRKDGDDNAGAQNGVAEFLRSALALLCLMDAALAWRSMDPLGILGNCEEGEGLLVGHEKGICSFPVLSARLRKSLKKASSGCKITWRRLRVHLDLLRARELPAPWPWVWVRSQDASVLVRNTTKVPLRVELFRTGPAAVSPWADWFLVGGAIQELRRLLRQDVEKAILEADVGPGIEWAMRPRVREGQHFQIRLLTEAGVVVCSKKLRRGQTLDFAVQVPPRKSRPFVTTVGRPRQDPAVAAATSAAVVPDLDAKPFETASVASTAVPSSSGMRSSTTSASSRGAMSRGSASSSQPTSQPAGASDMALEAGHVEPTDDLRPDAGDAVPPKLQFTTSRVVRPPVTSAEVLESSICPRCLREMAARNTRPAAPVYADGVRCDHCSTEMIAEGVAGRSREMFFHCGRCWFDLCHACALREMQDVWWDED